MEQVPLGDSLDGDSHVLGDLPLLPQPGTAAARESEEINAMAERVRAKLRDGTSGNEPTLKDSLDGTGREALVNRNVRAHQRAEQTGAAVKFADKIQSPAPTHVAGGQLEESSLSLGR